MLVILIIVLLFVDTSTSFPVTINFNISNCYNSSTYPPNSYYETNLNQLLSTLSTNISTNNSNNNTNNNGGFIQYQQGSSQNDTVYGVAWCRGDMTPTDCGSCVTSATSQVRSNCGRARQAIHWKEQCMLRYSNYSFFGLLETQPFQPMYNTKNVTDNVTEWIQFLNQALDKVANKAVEDDSYGEKYYATNEVVFRPTNVLWNTMAECMPDLSKDNCSSCLKASVSQLQPTVLSQGGIALTPVCNIRYENYPFYSLGTSQGQSPLPAFAPTNNGKKKQTVTKLVVAIIVPLAAVSMLIAIATYLLRKKAKKHPSGDVKNGNH